MLIAICSNRINYSTGLYRGRNTGCAESRYLALKRPNINYDFPFQPLTIFLSPFLFLYFLLSAFAIRLISSDHVQFSPFPRLPLELRQRICTMAIEPRLVVVAR